VNIYIYIYIYISTKKTKVTALKAKFSLRSEIIVILYCSILEETSFLIYLKGDELYTLHKRDRCVRICDTTRSTLKTKTHR
jgi:hypothetical protein